METMSYVPTRAEFNDETWDQTFLECLSEQTSQNGHSVESDTEDIDLLPPPLNIQRSYRLLAGCYKFS